MIQRFILGAAWLFCFASIAIGQPCSGCFSLSATNITAKLRLNVPRGTSVPSSGMVAGDLFIDSDANTPYWYDGANWVALSGSGGSSGHTIEDEGTPLAARSKLNFVGAGVTVTDDSGDDASVVTIPGGVTDHGALTGLGDDDHAQYPLSAGRATGQSLTGGTASGEDLTLQSTAHATKGDVLINTGGGNVGIGTAAPTRRLTVAQDLAARTAGQVMVSGAGLLKQLMIGYDTTANVGWLTAIDQSIGFRPLVIQPDGGTVGIGTASPNSLARLTVDGSIGGIYVPRTATWIDYNATGENHFGGRTFFRTTTGSATNAHISGSGSENTYFAAVGGGVGIGNASPGSLLHVGGATTRSTITLQSNSAVAKGRLHQANNDHGLYMSSNADFNGTSWNRDNTGVGAISLQFYPAAAAAFYIRGAAAGANPLTWTDLFQVTDAADVYAFGKMGINTTAPLTRLHARTGSAGTAYTPTADDVLTVEGVSTADAILQIFSAAAKQAGICFTDTAARCVGSLIYNHAVDAFFLSVAGSVRASLTATATRFGALGVDTDFNVRSVGFDPMFFVDASADRIGIATNSPGATLDVRGSAIFNEAGADADFRVEGDTNANMINGDASTNDVGIGVAPTSVTALADLDIEGTIRNEAWVDFTFENSWVDFDTVGYGVDTSYMRDKNGFVHLRGMAKNGSSATATITTLPVGYRPSQHSVFSVVSNSQWCRLDVLSDGQVKGQTAGASLCSTAWISLDGISYRSVGY